MTTVKNIIDEILSTIPGAPLEETVDTLKSGSMDEPVRGVATTFIATMDVLRKAVETGANFVITHEPTYYNHYDKTDWLAEDPVYAAKRKYIEDNGLTIWRFHDQWHMHMPDGIMIGVANALGWQEYRDPNSDYLFHLPLTPLDNLLATLKTKLFVPNLRVVAPDNMICQNVAALVGSPPGEWHIESMGKWGADTVLTGEVSEWQVYEYVRDSNAAGMPRALIIAGHERSEEPGMAYLAEWLKQRMPDLAVTHLPAGDPLTIR